MAPAVRARLAAIDLGPWLAPVVVYLAIRAVGVLVLVRFDVLHGFTLGDSLSAWDGEWMLAIAEHGYAGVPVELTDAQGIHTADTAYAFFPGYPYAVGWLARLPLVSPFAAAIGFNLVLGCLAAVGTARLGEQCARLMATRSSEPLADGADHRTGLVLVAIFAATPMSIVLTMAYTEALFCALSVWALVGVLRQRWILAGGCAALVGMVRPTAIVVIGIVVVAAVLHLVAAARSATTRAWLKDWAWAAIMVSPLGYLGYLSVVWAHTGSPTGWFTIQTQGWDTEFDGGAAAFDFVNSMLVNSGEVAPVVTSWMIVGTLVLIGVAAWARVPWPVFGYGTLVVASVVLSSGLMMSRPRLLLPAFVLLLPLAVLLARARPAAAVAALTPIIIGSAWYGAHMLTVYPHAI
ncbi:MAG: mannosyltransferase family protein [Gordonia sp. (in: high G+C Gram-positive bacteria)]